MNNTNGPRGPCTLCGSESSDRSQFTFFFLFFFETLIRSLLYIKINKICFVKPVVTKEKISEPCVHEEKISEI